MPRPSREELLEIIKGQNRNVDVVDPPKRRAKPRPEAVALDLAALRRKFGVEADQDGATAAELDPEDLASVDVRPAGAGPADIGGEPRTTVASGSLGKVIGEQG